MTSVTSILFGVSLLTGHEVVFCLFQTSSLICPLPLTLPDASLIHLLSVVFPSSSSPQKKPLFFKVELQLFWCDSGFGSRDIPPAGVPAIVPARTRRSGVPSHI